MKKLKKHTRYDKNTIGLEKGTFPKNTQWAIDQDYIDGSNGIRPLNAEEREWLAKFNNEYYGGKVKKGDKKALHSTDELRKDCYTRNNIRNRDLHSIKAAGGKCVLVSQEEINGDNNKGKTELKSVSDSNSFDHEDVLIELIDQKCEPTKKGKKK